MGRNILSRLESACNHRVVVWGRCHGCDQWALCAAVPRVELVPTFLFLSELHFDCLHGPPAENRWDSSHLMVYAKRCYIVACRREDPRPYCCTCQERNLRPALTRHYDHCVRPTLGQVL